MAASIYGQGAINRLERDQTMQTVCKFHRSSNDGDYALSSSSSPLSS